MAADPGRTLNPPSEQLSDAAPMSMSGSNLAQRCQGQGAHCKQQQEQNRAIKFEGQCKELLGQVYDYVNLQKAADQFMKTTQEICKYIGRTYTYGKDTKMALETILMPTLVVPEDPLDEATLTEKKI